MKGLTIDWKSYLSINNKAFAIVPWVSGMISQYASTLLHFSRIWLFGSFCKRLVTFKNSDTTCELISGFVNNSDSLIWRFFTSEESYKYIKTLVSKAMLIVIVIGFVPIKFKSAQINKAILKDVLYFWNSLLSITFHLGSRGGIIRRRLRLSRYQSHHHQLSVFVFNIIKKYS